jgi:murein DD-endopeptidase MepM/ murein hydrolase activator NlpD
MVRPSSGCVVFGKYFVRFATHPVGVAVVATAALWAWTAAPAVADTWRWPVRGDVLTDFADADGPYADGQHRGIDVAAPPGTPIVAAVGGHVRFAGLVGSSGLTVSVRTADGRFDTSYLHLSTASVRSGQAVAAGDRIGAVGTTGRPSAATPHLHFGIRNAGTRRYRDPLDFLPPLPGVRELPRGAPVSVRGPLRVGPTPQPVRPHRFPVVARQPSPAAAPSRVGWVIACAALIGAAALLSLRSSIGARAVLRHHTDLLRQR